MAGILKNPGPLLTSQGIGDEDAIPREWRAKLGIVKLAQENAVDILPDTITAAGLLVGSDVVQTRTDERKKVNTSVLTIGLTMISQERLSNGQIVNRTRSFQPENTPLPTAGDPTVIEAGQKNLGVGKLDQFIVQATLPGPSVVSSHFDTDSSLVIEGKTRKLITAIVEGEVIGGGFRTRTSREGETDLVATEVTSRDPVPGPIVPSSKLDPDGVVVSITKQNVLVTAVTDGETLIAGIWTRTYKEGESPLTCYKVTESRTVPGPTINSTRIDDDGKVVTVARTRKAIGTIVDGEAITGGVWKRTFKDAETILVATEVVETRVVPGNPITTTKVDTDGKVTTIVKTKKDVTTIVDGETLISGSWVKTYREAISDLVANEVKESRVVPGVGIPSASVDQDEETVTQVTTLKASTAIVPGSTVSGGVITSTDKKAVSDLVAQEIVSTRTFLTQQRYAVEVENPIPAQFKPFMPVGSTSNLVAGTAAIPMLGTDEYSRSEQQKTRLLKQVSSTALSPTPPVLPVTLVEQELTTEYGGLILNVTKTLDLVANQSIPNADLTNPTVIREIVTRHGRFSVKERAIASEAFAVLVGTDVDEELSIIMPYTKQVVAAGTVGSVGTHTVTRIKPLDAARSEKTVETDPGTIATFGLLMFGSTTVDLPPQLVSVLGLAAQVSGSAGSYGSNGTYTIYNGGSEGVNLHGEANGSASVTMDIQPNIKTVWGQDIQAFHCLFFVAQNATIATVVGRINTIVGQTVQFWPQFKPTAVFITCISQKSSGRSSGDFTRRDSIVADYQGSITHSGFADIRGSGVNYDNDVTVTTIKIPPTIHGAISLTGQTQATQNFAASGFVATQFGQVPFGITGGATGIITPTSIPATPNQATIPTTGFFLHRLRMEPYKLGYVKVFAEVINAALW